MRLNKREPFQMAKNLRLQMEFGKIVFRYVCLWYLLARMELELVTRWNNFLAQGKSMGQPKVGRVSFVHGSWLGWQLGNLDG